MKNIYFKLLTIATLMILASSCEKGEQGIPGKDGTVGKDGKDGKDGSVNVVSHTYIVNAWDYNSKRWYRDLDVPELNPSNLNSSSIQVYLSTATDVWQALPLTAVAFTNYFMGYLTFSGVVEIIWDYNGGGKGDDPNTFYNVTCQFKVVLIPSNARKANPKLDFNDYNAVKEKFDLKD